MNLMLWEYGIPGKKGTPWEGGLYKVDYKHSVQFTWVQFWVLSNCRGRSSSRTTSPPLHPRFNFDSKFPQKSKCWFHIQTHIRLSLCPPSSTQMSTPAARYVQIQMFVVDLAFFNFLKISCFVLCWKTCLCKRRLHINCSCFPPGVSLNSGRGEGLAPCHHCQADSPWNPGSKQRSWTSQRFMMYLPGTRLHISSQDLLNDPNIKDPAQAEAYTCFCQNRWTNIFTEAVLGLDWKKSC